MQWLVPYKVVPQLLAEVGEHKYYFTRVYGGYIYSYWDYKPTFTSLGGH